MLSQRLISYGEHILSAQLMYFMTCLALKALLTD